LTRTRLPLRNLAGALVLVLGGGLALAAAAPAAAITHDQASQRALAALGSSDSSGPVVVFALPRPLPARTRVAQARSRAPWRARPRAAVRAVRAPLAARVGAERAFFFYEDLGPGQAYPHAGRVALVGVRSGRVRISRTLAWAPLVNGRLPAFLSSARRYRSPRYRVFSSTAAPSPSSPGPFAPLQPPLPADPNSPPKADNQSATAKEGRAKHLTLTGSDDNGDLLTFHITKAPLRGTLTGQAPNVTYTPDPGYLGPDHFAFKVNDGSADSNTGQVTITVVPLGAPPSVQTSAGCTGYTEKAPAVVVDGQIAVSDPDDVSLDSATVRVAANFERGDDLLFTDQNGISGNYNDTTGVLTLVGTASIANYQAALRSVTYRNLSSSNPPATKDVEFTVNDAGNDSAPATKQICITGGAGGANDPPIGETGEGGLSYVENDGPVPVDGGFVVGDPDSANLSGATIQFAAYVSQPVDPDGNPVGAPEVVNSFAPAEDELAFTDQSGITGSYDDATGVLTLSGTSSVADYEAAIRSVTYENSSENPSEMQRRVRFQVTDSGGASSTPSTRDVFITAVNDAPVVTTSAGSTAYTENDPATPVDADLTVGDVDDVDLEGGEVRISSGLESADELHFADQNGISGTYDTGTGVLTLSGTASVASYEAALRSIEYSHAGEDPSSTPRRVELKVTDGDLESSVATKDIAVTPVNDAPVVATSVGSISYTEGDQATVVDSGVSVSDVDDSDLEGAVVRVSSGFQTGDELVFVDQSGITGSYDSSTGVLTLSGTASVADYQAALRSVEYGHTGDDPSASKTVEFKVDDGDDDSGAATRDIAVTPVNDKPVLDTSDAALSYAEGADAVAVDSGIAATDPDSDDLQGATVTISSNFTSSEDELAFTDQSGITGSYDHTTGTLTLSGTAPLADYHAALRSVTYENSSDAPSSATRTVTFQVDDGAASDNLSDPATRDVAVTPVNDAPVVATSVGSTSYTEGDQATAVDSGVTVSDVDDSDLEGAVVRVSSGFQTGDELVFVDQSGISGSYDSSTGVLTLSGSASPADYQAALRSVEYGHTGDDPSASKTVEFKVDDGDDDSGAATRDVAVTALNEAPVVATSTGSTSYTAGGPATAVDSGLTVSDADDTSLEGAQVRISSGFESGDSLAFVDQNGISGTYDTTTGVLTLSGSASLADYQTALRSIEYRHSETPSQTTKEVELKVNDGDVDSNAATKSIEVQTA
jgi:trimeric autotransporter adhesin